MYILVDDNGNFVREINLYDEYPNTSFPSVIGVSDLPANVKRCWQQPRPADINQAWVLNPPKLDENGWYQDWSPANLSEMQLMANKAMKWMEVRKERDNRVAEMDWRVQRNLREVRLGVQPTEDISAIDYYIKNLTELPDLQTDPFNIVWPVAPDPTLTKVIPLDLKINSVSMRQARTQLKRMPYSVEGVSLYDVINQTVQTLSDEAKIAWEYAITVNRTDPFVVTMIQMLGWDANQTDEFFLKASEI